MWIIATCSRQIDGGIVKMASRCNYLIAASLTAFFFLLTRRNGTLHWYLLENTQRPNS